MDIWKKMYEYAKKEYHPQEVTPFIYTPCRLCPRGRRWTIIYRLLF